MRKKIEALIKELIKENYSIETDVKIDIPEMVEHGDFSIPCFQFAKPLKKSPQVICSEIKTILDDKKISYIQEINNVNAYLNIKVKKSDYFKEIFEQVTNNKNKYGYSDIGKNQTVLIEFSSPNTNKPLHLGHVRNNVLGNSVSKIHEACGYNVAKANLINDRGIHICKSMLAWKKFSDGETPQSSGLKGDHLVGKYYVIFDKKLKEEEEEFIKTNNIDFSKMTDLEKDKFKEEQFYPNSKLLEEAREMLRKWESGDSETLELWKKLDKWAVDGMDETYKNLGIKFDKYYRESQTYMHGKKYVLEGLEKGICYQKEDGSIWVSLPKKEFGNDKLLLRSDGTSVYMTQDIGTSFLKHEDYNMDKSVYVVGSEQEYHFKVLFKILELLGLEKYQGCYHLSYGMIELPEGKMKSREGTVVDADDLMEEMNDKAKEEIISRNRPFTEEELGDISNIVALGALKYYILQYSSKTNFIFDPKASIDFNGKTGPYIQYTHARISSLINAIDNVKLENIDFERLKSPEEFYLLKLLEQFPYIIQKSCYYYNTSFLAEYLYDLASSFNTFYSKSDVKIKEMEIEEQKPRLALAYSCKVVLTNGLELLGITAPERM